MDLIRVHPINFGTMKKYYLWLSGLFLSFAIAAQGYQPKIEQVQLHLAEVDNHGFVPGRTYRVYLELPSPEHSLHAVFADTKDLMELRSTTKFYQHPMGGPLSDRVHPKLMEMQSALAFDSWMTIGAENSENNALWNIGIEFDHFLAGGDLEVIDGAVFLESTHPQTAGDDRGYILIAQLTSTGTVSGILNFQGWNAQREPWQARQVVFDTQDFVSDLKNKDMGEAKLFTEMEKGSAELALGLFESYGAPDESDGWLISPNPVQNGEINILFREGASFQQGQLTLEIFELGGRRVLERRVQAEDIHGRHLIIREDLAAGIYHLRVQNAAESSTRKLLIRP